MLESIYKLFTMFGGLGIFMYGMKIMGDSLENIAGAKIKAMFQRVSNNRMKGYGIGLGVTSLIQSSSATSVMLVGFVNVGFLSLTQATPILLGAIVGTTITGQLSSLSAFDITAIMSLIAAVGAFMYMFVKEDKTSHIGLILLGFGMIFIGLDLMSSSMKTFAFNSNGDPSYFAHFMLSFRNPFLCVLAGLFFTAIIQSSSASTGVLLALATAGVLTLEPAMYMLLGCHIGTCVTALIASIGTCVNARRTALINITINTIGTIFWFIIMLLFSKYIEQFIVTISGGLERSIANFHTISNFITSLLLLPFIKPLVKVIEKIIPEKPVEENSNHKLYYLDERILSTPSLAVVQTVNEVKNMAGIANYSLHKAIEMLIDEHVDDVAVVEKNEEIVNYLNIEISNYLLKLSKLDLSERDDEIVASMYHVVSDIERIGDYADNMKKFAVKMFDKEMKFSEDAKDEMRAVQSKLDDMYTAMIAVFETRNQSMLPIVDKCERFLDKAKKNMQKTHLERLHNGDCNVEVGSIYLSLATQFERVGDHMNNIAKSVLSYDEKMTESDNKAN